MAKKNTSKEKAMAKGTLFNPVKVMKRAIRCAGKDKTKEALTRVLLDSNGDVVSTDSYRVHIEHEAWVGSGGVELTNYLARSIAKCKITGNETADIEDDGKTIVVKMGSGEVFSSPHGGGTFPNFKKVTEQLEIKTVAYFYRDELLALAKQFVKDERHTMEFSVVERDLTVTGNGDCRFFEKICDGADVRIGFNPRFVRDAMMNAADKVVEIHIDGEKKPAIIKSGNVETVLMPVKLDKTAQKKTAETKSTKEENVDKKLSERIAELEAELKKRSEELEAVWKENEHLKREANPEPKKEVVATEVSLETLKAWAKGKELLVTQKNEKSCIWVEGDSKPYSEELSGMGLRFSKKRKSWYYKPATA